MSLFLAFLGWFIHPDQIFSRAVERLGDWETAVEKYKLEEAYGQRDADSKIRFQRLAQELAARRSEYYAAETRYRGEPEFFRSNFFAWSFWMLSGLSALGGLVAYSKHKSYRQSSEA